MEPITPKLWNKVFDKMYLDFKSRKPINPGDFEKEPQVKK